MQGLSDIIARINTNIINPFIFLLMAIAFVIFLWGIVDYFRNIDAPEERTKGIQHMIWGGIGLLIMISVKGIIAIIQNLVS